MSPARGSGRNTFLWPWRERRDGAARGRLLFVACLLLICGTTAFIGIVPTQIFGHDDFFWLANAWRTVCGQRPHLDFYSPWGPVMYLVVGLGMALSNASPNAIGYGSAIFGLLTGLWGYGLGRDRLETAWRVLFGLYLALLVTAPYALGTRPTWSTHAMVHNRYSFALVGLVLMECLQRLKGRDENAGEFWGGVSTGAAMAVALFLKASYFFVTLPIVGASLVLRGLNRRRLGGLAAGFGVVALALLAYVSFDVVRFVQDLRMAAAGRSMAMSPWDLADILRSQVPSLAVVIALYLYGSPTQKEKGRWLEEQELLIWGLLVFLADAMLIFSNMQARGMPLLGVFGCGGSGIRSRAESASVGGTKPGEIQCAAPGSDDSVRWRIRQARQRRSLHGPHQRRNRAVEAALRAGRPGAQYGHGESIPVRSGMAAAARGHGRRRL
ncbi:MAG: hypothetical protein ABSC08_17270 [Bryobacteraceae bacterium]